MHLNREPEPDSCEDGALWRIDQHGMSEETMIMMFIQMGMEGRVNTSESKGSEPNFRPSGSWILNVVQVVNARAWAKWEGYISVRGVPKWNVDLCELWRMFSHSDMQPDMKCWNPSWVRSPSCGRGSPIQDVRAHIEWRGNLYRRKGNIAKYIQLYTVHITSVYCILPLYMVVQIQYYSTVSI